MKYNDLNLAWDKDQEKFSKHYESCSRKNKAVYDLKEYLDFLSNFKIDPAMHENNTDSDKQFTLD